jgi:hypothetical protein
MIVKWRRKMPYDAKVFKIMIASPGDVALERNIVRDIIHEWNDIHSETRKIVLLPVAWDTHASPELGDRPQAIINKQVLEKCDLLVGVFWTRIGTDTGQYPSGTVEEIETHISLGRPAMLYFSNKPAHPDSIDQEQYAKLKVFKKSCEARGLCETYEETAEFQQKFFRQLQLKINEDELFANTGAEEPDTTIRDLRTPSPQLSREASILLKEASQDTSGMIFYFQGGGGAELQTHEKNFISDQNRRTVAKWEAALQELVTHEFIVDNGEKGEVFEVTDRGFQFADTLQI